MDWGGFWSVNDISTESNGGGPGGSTNVITTESNGGGNNVMSTAAGFWDNMFDTDSTNGWGINTGNSGMMKDMSKKEFDAHLVLCDFFRK